MGICCSLCSSCYHCIFRDSYNNRLHELENRIKENEEFLKTHFRKHLKRIEDKCC
jgi:hypothetical protein